MTIRQAIDMLDGQKPNQYSEEEKVRWLSDLDHNIYIDLILTHEHDADLPEFKGYTTEDMGKKLLADTPYDELYIAYLKMKIDEENAETQRYNNSAIMFNSYMDNFSKAWNRSHMPISAGCLKLF